MVSTFCQSFNNLFLLLENMTTNVWTPGQLSFAIITPFQNRLIFILHISTTMSWMIEKRTFDSSKNFQNAEHNEFFIIHSCISWSWSLQQCFDSLCLKIRKHVFYHAWPFACHIIMPCVDTRFEKQKPWCPEQANIFTHHTSSTIVPSEGINLKKSSLVFSN